jgi:hypothetical protein
MFTYLKSDGSDRFVQASCWKPERTVGTFHDLAPDHLPTGGMVTRARNADRPPTVVSHRLRIESVPYGPPRVIRAPCGAPV